MTDIYTFLDSSYESINFPCNFPPFFIRNCRILVLAWMFRVVICLVFFYSFCAANAEYRHIHTNKKVENSLYISLGLYMPLGTKITNFSKAPLSINPGSEVGQALTQVVGAPKTNPFNTSSMQFANRKLGATVAVGYKTGYLLRADVKLDFLTASHNIPFTGSISVKPPSGTGGSISVAAINAMMRQFSLMLSVYLDFDNSTILTPYIGSGLGVASTQIYGSIDDTSNNRYIEPQSNLLSNFRLVYEIKSGVRIGDRKVFLDVEYFMRRVPSIAFKSSGIKVVVGFRM